MGKKDFVAGCKFVEGDKQCNNLAFCGREERLQEECKCNFTLKRLSFF